MSEAKKGATEKPLFRYFDKVLIGVAALVLVAYFALGRLTYTPDPAIQQTEKLAGDVSRELLTEHTKVQPAPIPKYTDRAAHIWNTPISNFMASDWTTSYRTTVTIKPIESADQIIMVLKANTLHKSPQVRLDKPVADFEKVTVKATFTPPQLPSKIQEPTKGLVFYMDGDKPCQANTFAKIVVERLDPPDKKTGKSSWKEVNSSELKGTEKDFEYQDRDVTPKTDYAYRMICYTKEPAYGKRESEKLVSNDDKVRTPNIWQLALKFTIMNTQEERLEAQIVVMKFIKDLGSWLPKEMRVWEDIGGFKIGGIPVDKEGHLEWKFNHSVRDPATGKTISDVNFETKYIIKKIEKDVKVKAIQHRHDHSVTPYKEKDEPIEIVTDRLTYFDEDKQVQFITKNPLEVTLHCGICEKPPEPTKSEKAPDKTPKVTPKTPATPKTPTPQPQKTAPPIKAATTTTPVVPSKTNPLPGIPMPPK